MAGEANAKHLPKNIWRLLKKGHPLHAIGFLGAVIAYWIYALPVVLIWGLAYIGQQLFELLLDAKQLYAPACWLEKYHSYLHQLLKEQQND